MKLASVLFAALLVGCAHSAAPVIAVSAAAKTSDGCVRQMPDESLTLRVENRGPGKLSIRAQSESGPPFRMGWPYYAVLVTEADQPEREQLGAGHGPLPLATVTIGPNDGTEFLLYMGEALPVPHEARYRVRFEDMAGQIHHSAPFSLCVSRPVPN